MKKIVFFLFFISSVCCYADAGYSYRFFVKIKSDEGFIGGYIYHSSYDKYNQEFLLINYLKKTSYENKINLYTDIKTVNIKEFNVDFVIDGSEITVNLNDSIQIEKVETFIYNGDERLIKLNYDEFNLIKSHNPNSSFIYNESISENCTYILLSWNKIEKLSTYKTEIKKRLDYFSKNIEKYNVDFNNYIQAKKDDFLKKDILFVNHCSVL